MGRDKRGVVIVCFHFFLVLGEVGRGVRGRAWEQRLERWLGIHTLWSHPSYPDRGVREDGGLGLRSPLPQSHSVVFAEEIAHVN